MYLLLPNVIGLFKYFVTKQITNMDNTIYLYLSFSHNVLAKKDSFARSEYI